MTANISQIRLLGRGGGACPSIKARGARPALFRGVYDGAGALCQEKRGHSKDRALKNMEKIGGKYANSSLTLLGLAAPTLNPSPASGGGRRAKRAGGGSGTPSYAMTKRCSLPPACLAKTAPL